MTFATKRLSATKRPALLAGLTLLLVLLLPPSASAQLRLSELVSDGMVMQRGAEAPVWGWSDAGEDVRVTFRGETYAATPDSSGAWRVMLPAMEAGGPYELTVAAGNERVRVDSVLVGDVWVASGQSNMEWPVADAENAEQEIAAAGDAQLRHFKVPRSWAEKPEETLAGGAWEEADPEHAGAFTAVGYFFARALRPHADVPIGLINTSWGGSRIEPWMSAAMLGLSEAEVQAILKEEGTGERQNQLPTLLYNKMIYPLLDVPITGALWYQGESNAGSAEDARAYRDLFTNMIEGWRDAWATEGDFPFLFVQLANFKPEGTAAADTSWAVLREAQHAALALPNTAEAVIIDIGNPDDIHPRNKQDVGTRLARAARALAYGEELVYSGPTYRGHETLGDGRVAVSFDHAGGGLEARGSALQGFTIAGADGRFVPAEARIEEGRVVVRSDRVAEPTAVRYAWSNNPEDANLYNAEGLPAAPFRTDAP